MQNHMFLINKAAILTKDHMYSLLTWLPGMYPKYELEAL